MFAGRLATAGNLIEVSRAARELPWSERPGQAEMVLNAVTLLVTEGPVAAAASLHDAVAALSAADAAPEDHLRLGICVQGAAIALWDLDAWRTLVERHAAIVRAAGLLDQLPVVLVDSAPPPPGPGTSPLPPR